MPRFEDLDPAIAEYIIQQYEMNEEDFNILSERARNRLILNARAEIYRVSIDLRPYIRTVTGGRDLEEILEFDDAQLRSILTTAEEIRAEATRPQYFDFGQFHSDMTERPRRFWSHGRMVSYHDRVVSLSSDTPIILVPNVMNSFYDQLQRFIDQQEYNERLYQITFSLNNEMFINVHPGMIKYVLDKRLEDYEDEIRITNISIRYTSMDEATRRRITGGIHAGSGEGISRCIGNGFWLIDPRIATIKCILNVFISWEFYTQNKLNEIWSKIFNNRRKYLEKHFKMPKHLKFEDMCIIRPHDFKIVFSDDECVELNPEDTIKECVYLYRNNHVGLVIHESFLDKQTLTILNKQSKISVVCKIRPQKKKSNLISIRAADIECYRCPNSERTWHHIPMMIAETTSEGSVQFKGKDCIIKYFEYLVSKEENLLIWFHNGGKYDVHFMIKEAIRHCNKNLYEPIEIRDLNGRFIQMNVNLPNKHVIVFKDSYALLPEKLSTLAEDMNVTRKIEDINIIDVSIEDLLTSPKIAEYNMIDSIALYEILNKYCQITLENFQINPLKYVSASSFSKNLFYSKYYDPQKYPLYVLSKDVHDFIKRGYGGGRNEVFKKGVINGPLYPFDFSSFYPFAGTLNIPYNIPQWIENLKLTDSDQQMTFLNKYPGYYDVIVLSSPNIRYPLHGVLHEHKYVFPHFENYHTLNLFSEEIKAGIKLGYKYTILKGIHIPLGPVFKQYFEDLYEIKQKAEEEKKSGLRQTAKITMNSGYGYHGFDKYDRTVMRIYGKNCQDHLEALKDRSNVSYREEEGIFLVYERTDILLKDVNIAVAAAITSYARIRMCELLNDLDQEGYDAIYCDTDSVITNGDIRINKRLREKYMFGNKIGSLKYDLKNNNDYIKNGKFVGCKTYGYETTQIISCKSKGTKLSDIDPKLVGFDYEPTPSNKKEKEAITLARKKYMYDKFSELLIHPITLNVSTISNSRIRKVKKDLEIYDNIIPKTLSGIYTKGIVQSDGTIIPFTLTSNI